MNLHKINGCFTIALFLSTVSVVQAADNWSLEHLASNKKLAGSGQHKDPKLAKKMDNVFEYLKGSWCSQEKAKLIMELVISQQLATCVEVGTFSGSSALPMLVGLEYLKKGHAYLIDAWSTQEAVKGLDQDDPNAKWWSTLDMNAVKNQLLHMLGSWNLAPYCTVIHATSENAKSQLGSIDFLHLDGNFSASGAILDTDLYLPLVKSGGYILVSNTLLTAKQIPTKMKALWPLFDQCAIVSEIENGNVFLFRKK